METVSNLVTISLANYLARLPLPKSLLGWFSLGAKDWMKLVPFFTTVGGVSYLAFKVIRPSNPVNPSTRKDLAKVVDQFEMEDLDSMTAFCRCWRSSKFPYCDGSHNGYNLICGDNVGPIVVKKKVVAQSPRLASLGPLSAGMFYHGGLQPGRVNAMYIAERWNAWGRKRFKPGF